MVLNTGTDMERLVAMAAALYEKWSACGMGLCIRTYSVPELTPEAVVFRLWSIGPELTVMVGLYRPTDRRSIEQAGVEVWRLFERLAR